MITYPRLIAELESFGVKTDKTAAEALHVIAEAQAARNTEPLADLRTAYADGEVTSANARDAIIKAATQAAASERIHLAASAIQDVANGTLRRWIGIRENEIITALRKPFDETAALVHVAGQHFPPGATARQLLDGGSAAVAANENLDAALSTLQRIRSCRVQVADCAGSGEQDVTWYIAGAEDLDHLDAARRAYSGSGDAFHALAHAGFTLRLNTTAEAARVAGGARTVSEAQESARRKERVQELREKHLIWPTSERAGA